jgi:hypothetical protein
MDQNKVRVIIQMIKKECCRNSLAELCESWGLTCEDFDEFIGKAMLVCSK